MQSLYDLVMTIPRPDDDAATRMLVAASAGNAEQAERLLATLYAELHATAEGYMNGQGGEHTLQPTALVHEAWMKLFGGETLSFQDRHHFLATAARAMRQILVDHARGRKRAKRGADWKRIELQVDPAVRWTAELDLEDLDQALRELEAEFPRQAKIVELRYFGDMSVEETAKVLRISERTVAREWRFARAWLSRALDPETGGQA